MIRLTREPVDASSLGASGRALAVVAPGYEAPGGLPVVALDALLAEPARYLDGEVTLVVVGLSRMMTPSNRVQLGRVLLRPRAGLRRISVDEVLFVSEPWRLWWHFFAVGAERWGLTDSFLAETRWRAALELRTPDPFGRERVLEVMRGVVSGVDPFRFPPIPVEVLPVAPSARAAYARLKEEAFAEEKSIAAIIRRLAAFAQEAEPARSVPAPASLWRRVPGRIVRTDLAVDTFLVGQLLERVALTNAIADAAEAGR